MSKNVILVGLGIVIILSAIFPIYTYCDDEGIAGRYFVVGVNEGIRHASLCMVTKEGIEISLYHNIIATLFIAVIGWCMYLKYAEIGIIKKATWTMLFQGFYFLLMAVDISVMHLWHNDNYIAMIGLVAYAAYYFDKNTPSVIIFMLINSVIGSMLWGIYFHFTGWKDLTLTMFILSLKFGIMVFLLNVALFYIIIGLNFAYKKFGLTSQ